MYTYICVWHIESIFNSLSKCVPKQERHFAVDIVFIYFNHKLFSTHVKLTPMIEYVLVTEPYEQQHALRDSLSMWVQFIALAGI